jgi:hypothetical protein
LNVPLSRLEKGEGFQIGRAAEIQRDEVKFAKFIHRVRLRFTHLFDDLLKKQLVSKNIIKLDEWPLIKEEIKYDFNTDNHYAELKEGEILKSRLDLLQTIEPYTKSYFSKEWVRRNILHLSADERLKIQKEIEEEASENNIDVITPDEDTTA